MPQTIESDILYSTITIQIPDIPSNYDEADKLMGATGAALKGWQADCLARNFLPRLYAAVAKVLEDRGDKAIVVKTINETKKVDGVDKEVPKDVYETDIKHVGRIYKKSDAAGKEQIAALLQTTAKSIPFYAAGDRSDSGKIAEQFLNAAKATFAKGETKVLAIVSAIETNTPGYKVQTDSAGNYTEETVARGIAAMDRHLVAKARAQRAELLQTTEEDSGEAAQ